MLFIRNATSENRQSKAHFLKNDNFLQCLVTFMTQHNQHPMLKAQACATIWSLVHNHQGIKAALNKSEIINELQMLRSEYQRVADKQNYLSYVQPETKVQWTMADEAIR